MSKSIRIRDPRELGRVFRATRKLQHLRQDEVGRLSHSFIGELETGKSTAQIGKVLDALRELGLQVFIELPPGIDPQSFETARAGRK
jgi:transcriptional regulator with XRE-family HTH domain